MHGIDDDHRPLEERRFERRRAAGDERDIACGERVVRAAVEQLDRRVGSVLATQRLDDVAQPRDDRDHEPEAGLLAKHFDRGAEQARRDVLDLGAAAAG